MQANIQASIAVSPSAFGVLVVTVLKMLTSTRNKVTRRAILPGMTSIGMRNDIQDTITNKPSKQRQSVYHKIYQVCLKFCEGQNCKKIVY